MAEACRIENISRIEWAGRYARLAESLADCPLDIIQGACKRWYENHTFFPALNEFLDLVRPLLGDRKRELNRLIILNRVAENPAPDGIVTREWWSKIRS